MDETPRLGLPYIMPQQAQKHLTHNEALNTLDILVQASVASHLLAAPPATPGEGECHIVAVGATGAWAGHGNAIARYGATGGWEFIDPAAGWIVHSQEAGTPLTFGPDGWVPLAATLPGTIGMIGVNAAADSANRLVVCAPATLLTHEGAGHQVKINKAGAAQTASLLYQTGYSGRAEMGLAGDDDWHLKVSADGSSFTEALVVERATGAVRAGVSLQAPVLKVDANAQYSLQSGAPTLGFDTGDTLSFDRAANALKATIGGTVRLTLAGDGKLGVGTAPFTALHSYRAVAGGAPATSGTVDDNVTARLQGNTVALDVGILAAGHTWIQPRAAAALATNYSLLLAPNGGNVGIGTAAAPTAKLGVAGVVGPTVDNAYTLGASGLRWSAVWSANGTIQTSDARDKAVLGRMPAAAGRLVDAVDPVLFRWHVGSQAAADEREGEAPEAPRAIPGQRVHAGFVAQEIKAALDAEELDFGVWGLSDRQDPDSRQWLRPDQLIPVLWTALREVRARLRALEARVPA